MKRTRNLILLGIPTLLFLMGRPYHAPKEPPEWGPSTGVSKVLFALGKEKPLHALDSIDPEKADRGEELIKTGRTTWPDGSKSRRISKFYTCNDCHNLKKEDPDLSVSDPEARLQYAIDRDLPFLQGTTLYGVVNRESWYNGDYVEKYGEGALRARDTLRNAIQLCATECAQGRPFSDREMEAVLHYLWSIQLELDDIAVGIERIEELEEKAAREGKQKEALRSIEERFLSGSPATFLDALPNPERGMGREGDPEMGRAIYERSCLHCHRSDRGITRFTLDRSKLTFKMLKRDFDSYEEGSIYQVIRYGTSPRKGYRPYMPHYTKERMSNGQIEDLAAYIRKRAES